MFPMYIFIPNNVYLAMKLKICHYGCELREMRVDMNVFTLLLPFPIVFSHFPLLMRALSSLPANNDPGLLSASLCCAFLYQMRAPRIFLFVQ